MLNPVKIAAIAFILGVVLIVSIFATPSFFGKQTLKEESADTSIEKQTENSFKNPLTWLKENIQPKQNILPLPPADNLVNPLPKIIDDKTATSSRQLNLSYKNAPPTQPQPSEEELLNYLTILNQYLKDVSFTEEEFEKIQKDALGRPLSLEALIEEASLKSNNNEYLLSFRAWEGLSRKTVPQLKKITPQQKLSVFHQELIAWYEYFNQAAGEMSEENLSPEEIKIIASEFSQKKEKETPQFQSLFQEVSYSRNFFSGFLGLISNVYAQTEALICYFGGPIKSPGDTCTNGAQYVITPPPGKNFCGPVWKYYWQDPLYSYHLFTYSACVLGKAVRTEVWCNQGEANYLFPSAWLIYAGSAPNLWSCKSAALR